MRGLFGASPHRSRNNNSRDSADHHGNRGEDKNQSRRSFAFMKYSPDRRSSASMKASREHARQIAMKLSMNEPEPMFQASFPDPNPAPAAQDMDFNPFGHTECPPVEQAPQEDFFAMQQPTFNRKNSASSHRSSAHSNSSTGVHRDTSFDESVSSSGAAYDMDFLPIVGQQSNNNHNNRRRRPTKGRPPRSKAPLSEASFASFSSQQWPSSEAAAPLPPHPPRQQQSMSTFPSNSSMQSSFAHQSPRSSPPIVSQGSEGAGGAAARRRMRSQIRQGSSTSSICSDTASVDGTPPASPMSTHRRPSNGSVGSAGRNRVASYSVSNSSNWQSSPSPSVRGSGASVCSSINGSDTCTDLFDSQGEGGFTFDAFGLDANEIDREVQEAMKAITDSGHSDFGGFVKSSQHDISGDDFAPQAWDSPPESRRSTPTPKEADEEGDGFVDGFRVSKPSPLPLVQVHRNSPVSSEKSSSLSSITDQNNEAAPRRNVFKEKAGFMSSKGGRPQPPPQRTPPPPAKKEWKPPPGAVKILTPPRREVPGQRSQSRRTSSAREEEETDNYWKNQLPSPDEQPRKAPVKRSSAPAFAAQKWQSAANNSQQPNQPKSNFTKEQEEKKDDDEERDNQTDTTAAMTTVVSEPISPRRSIQSLQQQPLQRQQQQQPSSTPQPSRTLQAAPLKKENLEKLQTDLEHMEEAVKPLSPQEQRRQELEVLRSGGSSTTPSTAFKSQALMHHQNQDSANRIKPQQQRVAECSNQRTSFGSLKERLKSPVEHEHKASSTPQPAAKYRNSQMSTASAVKSEVGVSSFTRQKMKLASMSSAGTKSEVGGYAKSPRNPQQQPVVNAVLNKMKYGHLGTPGSNGIKNTDTGSKSAPAFMAVQLRKTTTVEQSSPSDEPTSNVSSEPYEEPPRSSPTYQSQAAKMQVQQKQQFRPSTAQQQQQQEQYPTEQAHQSSDEQHYEPAPEQPRAPSPKRLSYRERRELELKQEQEARQQEQEAQEPPKRDVADLIRRRIAANKSKNVPAPSSKVDEEAETVALGQNHLRPTGLKPALSNERRQSSPREEEVESVSQYQQRHNSPERYEDVPRTSSRKAQNEYEYHQQQSSSNSAQDSYQQQKLPSDAQSKNQQTSPRHSQSEYQHSSPRHAQNKNESSQPIQQPRPQPTGSAGGLSALHAQLKTLQGQQAQEEEGPGRSSPNRKQKHQQPQQPSEAKSAPRRVQALVQGNELNVDVQITRSHSSEHNSPTRTPKATYAMLNAFLHGREAIASAADEAPTPAKDAAEEKSHASSSAPSKSSHASAHAPGFDDGRPALKDDPKYSRYFKMLKIGMPLDVVKHAMARDGLDGSVMDGDHSKPAMVGIPLKDDPKYSKYFKMLKIGMPMEAVKHAMERDGLDSHVMDQDHNLPAKPSKGKKDDEPKEKDSHRRARLHWKPKQVRSNSLWAKIDEDPALDNIEIDEEEFAELFQAEIQNDNVPRSSTKLRGSPRKGAGVRVIDPKRANNGGIILARLKMSHDDMADVVDRMYVYFMLPSTDQFCILCTYPYTYFFLLVLSVTRTV
jgi:hypothetical protein